MKKKKFYSFIIYVDLSVLLYLFHHMHVLLVLSCAEEGMCAHLCTHKISFGSAIIGLHGP